MAKFCSKCGNELKEGARFCSVCGNPVKQVQSAQSEEKLKEQIVRYDESWLASNINEALYKSVLTPELLTYIVDDIKIKSVENTEDTTTISVSAKLRRTILENEQHIVVKNEKENWTLSRALHPNRLK